MHNNYVRFLLTQLLSICHTCNTTQLVGPVNEYVELSCVVLTHLSCKFWLDYKLTYFK